MSVKNTISITEARNNLFNIAEEVQKPSNHYTLTEKGRPKVVILSAEEYESMVETMEVDRLFPNLDKDIAETEEAFKSGEYKKWPTLDDLKKDWGFVVADKSAKKYNVHTRHKAKSKKKSR